MGYAVGRFDVLKPELLARDIVQEVGLLRPTREGVHSVESP